MNNDIKSMVLHAEDITGLNISGKSRRREYAEVRFMCMYWIRQTFKPTLKELGLVFSGRDHSTVMHALSVHKDLMETDKDYRKRYHDFKRRMNAEFVNKPSKDQVKALEAVYEGYNRQMKSFDGRRFVEDQNWYER